MDYKFYVRWCKYIGLNPVSPQSMAKFQELNTNKEIRIRGNKEELI